MPDRYDQYGIVSSQQEPPEGCTYNEYCAYLTETLGLRLVRQLNTAQLERFQRLRAEDLAQRDAAWARLAGLMESGVVSSRVARAPTKDEPDQ